MGILDSKKRFIDTLITDEGRRQMSRGKMNIRFATFTDQDAYYEGDIVSGTVDASLRPHLEAFSRPQDRITFSSDEDGNLFPFPGARDVSVIAGKVRTTSSSAFLSFPSASVRRDAQTGLLSSSVDNFNQLYAIGTADLLDDTGDFRMSRERIDFDVTDELLNNRQGIDITTIDDVESLFQDKRLSHIDNFKYLPPVNAPTPGAARTVTSVVAGDTLANYPRIGQGEILTYEQLQEDLHGRDVARVDFSEGSRDNNVFGQFFELRDDNMRKLDAIDFGEFIDAEGNSHHVYFFGRILKDSRGSHTFVNMFTVDFS